jgi:hypothetical protein
MQGRHASAAATDECRTLLPIVDGIYTFWHAKSQRDVRWRTHKVGKKSDKREAEDKARRKLAKAQLQMQIAQEKRRQAMTRGEHEVEQARLRAAKWLEKATWRVEQSAALVARAEAAVIRAGPPSSAAETLQRETHPAPQRPDESLSLSEPVEALRAAEESSGQSDACGNDGPS